MLVCFSLRAGFADFPFTANCSGVVIPSHRQLSNTAATYRQLFAPDNAEYSMTARISSGAILFSFPDKHRSPVPPLVSPALYSAQSSAPSRARVQQLLLYFLYFSLCHNSRNYRGFSRNNRRFSWKLFKKGCTLIKLCVSSFERSQNFAFTTIGFFVARDFTAN